MPQLQDFYNRGFGWVCRHCQPESEGPAGAGRSRLMSEGEAENSSPQLSTVGLAKWADPAHRILTCPGCGISELADKA